MSAVDFNFLSFMKEQDRIKIESGLKNNDSHSLIILKSRTDVDNTNSPLKIMLHLRLISYQPIYSKIY